MNVMEFMHEINPRIPSLFVPPSPRLSVFVRLRSDCWHDANHLNTTVLPQRDSGKAERTVADLM
jgi:hypothetical protein